MIKLPISDVLDFETSRHESDLNTPFVIIGALQNATASSVQFSADDFTHWLTLPTALIEEAICLGLVESPSSPRQEHLPLFSISLKKPQTPSERFFFDLITPPLFKLSRQGTRATGLN